MRVRWGSEDAASWDAQHAAALGSLQQDWAYGACLSVMGVPVFRARIVQGDEVVGLAQFAARRLGWVANVALCSFGPVWLRPLSAQDKAQAYRELRKTLPTWWPRLSFFTPEELEGPDTGLSSLRRIYTGQATVSLDLTLPLQTLRERLDGKWRNRLVAAEKSGLSVHRVGTNPGQYRWLLDQDQELRSQRGLLGLPAGLVDLYIQSRKQPSRTVLTLRADQGKERVAGMMFLLHGQRATYQVGWSNDEGRELGAHNLILWSALAELQSRGIRALDLGIVNTGRSAGLARFKIGTGGQVLRLCGTYL